ncbi:VOC family protein [Dinoroseobacter sp. S375]|uniref:VOC family protein n=1 Tax=Dinoroseobacter sp. S375 TaxID=3415136 RepID=UPI003C7B4E62
MPRRLAALSLVVDDYDRAIAFFTQTLGFELREDTRLSDTKRWVRVAPPGAETEFLLARAATPSQVAVIGQQGGGRVWLFLETEDFGADFARLSAAGVPFESPPRDEPYGTVAVFADPWGNRWDLIQYADPEGRSGTQA